MDGKKEKRYIVVNNFKFIERRAVRHGMMYRCTYRKCKTYVNVDASLNRIIKQSDRQHDHEPLTDQEVARHVIKCAAVQRGLADLQTRRGRILRRELNLNPGLAVKLTFGDYGLIRKSINCARKKLKRSTDSGAGPSSGQDGKGKAKVTNRIPCIYTVCTAICYFIIYLFLLLFKHKKSHGVSPKVKERSETRDKERSS